LVKHADYLHNFLVKEIQYPVASADQTADTLAKIRSGFSTSRKGGEAGKCLIKSVFVRISHRFAELRCAVFIDFRQVVECRPAKPHLSHAWRDAR
jgi:hypothetical protein